MKPSLILSLGLAFSFVGCATPKPLPQLPRPNLPPGSHAYGEADYSKQDGVTGKVGIDIPLDSGYIK